MKSLIYGVALIIVLGVGGFLYRSAVEHPSQATVACPVNALQCPDGTSVPHLTNSCDFPACSAPNVSFPKSRIAFAVPAGFEATSTPDASSIAAYAGTTTEAMGGTIVIRRFAVQASSTALVTIRETAIGGASGAPVPITAFSSTILGRTNFTVVTIERFEGVIDVAYYLSRGSDVLRFDAIDRNVLNWTSSNLDVFTLPANKALRKLLSTLE